MPARRASSSCSRRSAPATGLVLEVGCGSGLLTRHLVDAGHRVIATDASPAMLEIARETVPDAEELRLVRLPDDPLPPADAVVGIGHPLNYLPDAESLRRALATMASSLRPGGILATDICDLEWGRARQQQPAHAQVHDDWAIITRFALPEPTRYVREITTFVRDDDGSWRRDDEHHDNVLVDTSTLPGLLATFGVQAEVGVSFGSEDLPTGLHTIIGRRT